MEVAYDDALELTLVEGVNVPFGEPDVVRVDVAEDVTDTDTEVVLVLVADVEVVFEVETELVAELDTVPDRVCDVDEETDDVGDDDLVVLIEFVEVLVDVIVGLTVVVLVDVIVPADDTELVIVFDSFAEKLLDLLEDDEDVIEIDDVEDRDPDIVGVFVLLLVIVAVEVVVGELVLEELIDPVEVELFVDDLLLLASCVGFAENVDVCVCNVDTVPEIELELVTEKVGLELEVLDEVIVALEDELELVLLDTVPVLVSLVLVVVVLERVVLTVDVTVCVPVFESLGLLEEVPDCEEERDTLFVVVLEPDDELLLVLEVLCVLVRVTEDVGEFVGEIVDDFVFDIDEVVVCEATDDLDKVGVLVVVSETVELFEIVLELLGDLVEVIVLDVDTEFVSERDIVDVRVLVPVELGLLVEVADFEDDAE